MSLISLPYYNRIRRGALTIILMWGVCLGSYSTASEKIISKKLALDEVIKIAVEKNPQIQAAKAKTESMEAKATAEKSLPAPEVGIEFWGIGGEPSSEERWYSLMQTVPFPSKIFSESAGATHSARRERELAEGKEREITTKVKQAYYELFYIQKASALYLEQVEILNRLARSAKTKYSVGKGTQVELLQAQVELAKMKKEKLIPLFAAAAKDKRP